MVVSDLSKRPYNTPASNLPMQMKRIELSSLSVFDDSGRALPYWLCSSGDTSRTLRVLNSNCYV